MIDFLMNSSDKISFYTKCGICNNRNSFYTLNMLDGITKETSLSKDVSKSQITLLISRFTVFCCDCFNIRLKI